MKNLEKYISENRNHFEAEPRAGHFNRFKDLLEKQTSVKKISVLPQLLKVAAIIVLVVLSSLWTYEKVFSNQKEKGLSLSDVSPEYREVEQFFVQEVSFKYNQIKNSDFLSDSTQKILIMEELSEMDSIYNSMKKDLKTSPNDERIINAMIEHYQLKLEVMTNLLEQLQEINTNNKQTGHENNEI